MVELHNDVCRYPMRIERIMTDYLCLLVDYSPFCKYFQKINDMQDVSMPISFAIRLLGPDVKYIWPAKFMTDSLKKFTRLIDVSNFRRDFKKQLGLPPFSYPSIPSMIIDCSIMSLLIRLSTSCLSFDHSFLSLSISSQSLLCLSGKVTMVDASTCSLVSVSVTVAFEKSFRPLYDSIFLLLLWYLRSSFSASNR